MIQILLVPLHSEFYYNIMMRIFKSVFSQCGRPDGFLGRMVLRSMNLFHAPITNWGLGVCRFQGWNENAGYWLRWWSYFKTIAQS